MDGPIPEEIAEQRDSCLGLAPGTPCSRGAMLFFIWWTWTWTAEKLVSGSGDGLARPWREWGNIVGFVGFVGVVLFSFALPC
ncbi:hypothetical protein BO94DRAFT_538272 [Aspergillus sclerotioniger CBS 115572]|uniref:Uncharacterized protein n=1 Tax=Aspergillus sclerotioniger CBS 115572 TaxID=1450535 RepID=A0A317VWV2_9EURO|nr:hypothetical protein BO94DRAFT_538272 [Aspergillus sclerotioniger CBS 115572]PWY76400.1 hypothetical protein BO94DRAFT_538272 [Aspergillus sclerotioniger CBS 115572]